MNISKGFAYDISQVYDAYADMLFRLALSQLQNVHDAEDALQEVFIKFISASPAFRDESHLKAWLIRVTVNLCHDMLRKQKVRSAIPIDDVEHLASNDNSKDAELLSELMTQLYVIPEKYRSAIVLHELEGFSVEETAKSLGITVSAAKMRLSRGRQFLKEKISGGESNA